MPSSGGSHYRRKVISVEATSQLHVGWFAAGFIDGSVRLYDARTPEIIQKSTYHGGSKEMKRKANTQSLKEMATLLSAEQMRKEFLS
ncbi:Regulatory-associated protein of TOR [Trifolium repens]|nr:Regulatory-associated protein of TOR [Trifolium repens]